VPKSKLAFNLFIIILLEGFIVLSAELLAMRQTIPFVGSGTDTFSVIIAAVLIPLAFGYKAGGRFKQGFNAKGKYQSIRNKLLKNLIISSIFLLIGLSYFLMTLFFFVFLENLGIQNRTAQITVYSILFLVYPVYLLGQTVPLICNYFPKEKLPLITGKILFISTVGSFTGSITTTLILMNYLGTHHTVSIIFLVLTFLFFILSKKKISENFLFMVAISCIALYLNSESVMSSFNIVKNNKYNTIIVTVDDENRRHLDLNNNDSSMYDDHGRKHEYIEFMEKITIDTFAPNDEPKDILIIGAGAFTFGHEDHKNNYIYLDIDKDLKEVAEKYILKAKIPDNQIFIVSPVRAYLSATDKKFDVIILDAYLGGLSIPEHLVTKEFFEQIKEHMKEGGTLATNFILSPTFGNKYSQKIDNTVTAVFPYISRYIPKENYNLWHTDSKDSSNICYIYYHNNHIGPKKIITDN